tara:strand:+ start:1246 stop:1440 length:195 start_codon:yes stop_codon:yes gene_type:complete
LLPKRGGNMAKKISIGDEIDSSAADYISEVIIEILDSKEIGFTAFNFSIEVNYEEGDRHNESDQ